MKLFKFEHDYELEKITLILFGFKFSHKTRKNNTNKISCNIGEKTYLGYNVWIVNPKTTIGKYCSLANNISIGLPNHPMNLLSTNPFAYIKYKELNIENTNICHIGNDVWIGQNVSIIGGIEIGDGAVIGAGAIVTKDVPPYAIVAGVPAKIIRYRFEPGIIKKLLNLKWWDLPYKELENLPFNNINACIQILKSGKNENLKL